MAGPMDFLLNRETDEDKAAKQVVEAPAFSLTKVLGAGAVIVAPIATVLVEQLEGADLDAPNYVALAIALLGFLAVTAAADVLARSLATAADKNAKAVEKTAASAGAGLGHFIRFDEALAAHQGTGLTRSSVDVLAVAQADEPYFLVKNGDSIKWEPKSDITIP